MCARGEKKKQLDQKYTKYFKKKNNNNNEAFRINAHVCEIIEFVSYQRFETKKIKLCTYLVSLLAENQSIFFFFFAAYELLLM